MIVTINGEEKIFEKDCTIDRMLTEIGINAKKIAVERNLEIVPKSEFSNIKLSDGDKIEIVAFIGGG